MDQSYILLVYSDSMNCSSAAAAKSKYMAMEGQQRDEKHGRVLKVVSDGEHV